MDSFKKFKNKKRAEPQSHEFTTFKQDLSKKLSIATEKQERKEQREMERMK